MFVLVLDMDLGVTQDCYEKMKEFVKAHALIVGGIGVGIAVLLIFGMILSLALYLVIE